MNISQIILVPGQTLEVTGAADIHVTAHYADHSGAGQLTPGNQLTVLTGTDSTTVCGAPATGKQRIIKSLSILNLSGGTISDILVAIKSGSTVVKIDTFNLSNKANTSF